MAKRKAPSRARYEAEHPSLTVRVPIKVKAQVQAAAQAESLSVSKWVQALAAGHAANACQAYQNGLITGRAQGRRLEAILEAASLSSRYGGQLGGTEDCWFDRLAAPWAKNLAADDVAYLREFLANKPNLTQAVRRWLEERGIAASWP